MIFRILSLNAGLLTLDNGASLRLSGAGNTLNVSNISVGASGTVAPGALDLDWRVAVADLAKVNPNVTGPFQATGKISGSADNLTVTSDLTGTVGATLV